MVQEGLYVVMMVLCGLCGLCSVYMSIMSVIGGGVLAMFGGEDTFLVPFISFVLSGIISVLSLKGFLFAYYRVF